MGDPRPLLEALAKACPRLEEGGAVVASVGGGGKTGILFALAGSLADRGREVVLTTTTHIRDPRQEAGRHFTEVLLVPDWEGPGEAGALAPGPPRGPGSPGRILVLASRLRQDQGRLVGIHPSRVPGLGAQGFTVLVEADGSRELPIKAPGAHEPVLPPRPDLVLGMVGLDSLGQPLEADKVHRPELLGPLVGCQPGEAQGLDHILALALAPEGLFKSVPPGAAKALVLNKADLLAPRALADLESRLSAWQRPEGLAVIVASVRQAWAVIIP